jgi:hypothetical protein
MITVTSDAPQSDALSFGKPFEGGRRMSPSSTSLLFEQNHVSQHLIKRLSERVRISFPAVSQLSMH